MNACRAITPSPYCWWPDLSWVLTMVKRLCTNLLLSKSGSPISDMGVPNLLTAQWSSVIAILHCHVWVEGIVLQNVPKAKFPFFWSFTQRGICGIADHATSWLSDLPIILLDREICFNLGAKPMLHDFACKFLRACVSLGDKKNPDWSWWLANLRVCEANGHVNQRILSRCQRNRWCLCRIWVPKLWF